MFEDLTKPVSPDSPAGDGDIRRVPGYAEMIAAMAGSSERVMGDSTVPAVPPNFKLALRNCLQLLTESRHMELLVVLVQCATVVHGFRGFAGSVDLFCSLIKTDWDSLHPQADSTDPEDPWWERRKCVVQLDGGKQPLDALYRTDLVEVRGVGEVSLRDYDISCGKLKATDADKERSDSAMIVEAFKRADPEKLAADGTALKQAKESLQELKSLLEDRLGSDSAPTFSKLAGRLENIDLFFDEYSINNAVLAKPVESLEPDSAPLAGMQSDSASLSAVANSDPAKIYGDRFQAIAAMDGVIRFYEHSEPSSPVLVLMRRVRDMVGKAIMPIMKELSPADKSSYGELVQLFKTKFEPNPVAFLMEYSFNHCSEIDENSNSGQSPQSENGGVNAYAGGSSQSDEQEEKIEQSDKDDITSRRQVVEALSNIQAYFELHEPSSPIPLVVRETKGLVSKDFKDIITHFGYSEEEGVSEGE